ncbi:MAG: sulfatase [Bacteroidetes bacterium]|nr:MAG: sulfatase [Bacteroidota bacterium]
MKFLFFIYIIFLPSCKQDIPVPDPKPFKTKNVFIVVMDGSRYTESWGEPNKINIPNIKQLFSQGVMCSNFYNDGQTVTVPGHTAMTTGYYQVINNGGQETPANPSVFQYYLSQFFKPSEDAWVISSKDKLEVLSNCTDTDWAGVFNPRTDCGVNGNHTGYRDDSITFRHLIDTITKYHPHMGIVNFKEPDASGHAANWLEYIQQTKNVDKYIGSLWNFLQSDSLYAGTTTLFVTNDHGRHSDGVYDGFVSHGCDCLGCRHIFLLGIGPDFKTNYIETAHYSLIDIPSTVCKLMGINMPGGQGKVMETIFK